MLRLRLRSFTVSVEGLLLGREFYIMRERLYNETPCLQHPLADTPIPSFLHGGSICRVTVASKSYTPSADQSDPPPPPPAMSPASERHSDEPSPPEPLNCEAARLIANENILHPHELARDPV